MSDTNKDHFSGKIMMKCYQGEAGFIELYWSGQEISGAGGKGDMIFYNDNNTALLLAILITGIGRPPVGIVG